MEKTTFRLAEDVLIERLGEEFLVMPADSAESLRLAGEAATVVHVLLENGRSAMPKTDALSELLAAGIVKTHDGAGPSRRSLLKTGAIGVGAGVASLALPTAASAASVTYVDVTGEWGVNLVPSSGAAFFNQVFDWPDGLGDATDLTIISLSGMATPFLVPLTVYDAGGDFVLWESDRDFTSAPGAPGDIAVGTFILGEQNYRMTFSHEDRT